MGADLPGNISIGHLGDMFAQISQEMFPLVNSIVFFRGGGLAPNLPGMNRYSLWFCVCVVK